MKILIALSLLVFCVSAKITSRYLHLVDPTAETTCNVTEPRICGNYRWHAPERRMAASGRECFEDTTHRRADTGTAYIHHSPDSFTTWEFEIHHFFDEYTMIVDGQTIEVPARTIYRWEKDSSGIFRCDKFEMNSADVYRKPGVPDIFQCRGNIVQGWKNSNRESGILMKICNYSWTTETRYDFLSVTEFKCYPVKLSDVRRDKFHRTEIVEEANFFNWDPNFGAFPQLPPECWNV